MLLLLTVVLLVLLPLLATLQYRWLGQVSEGERERMHASLQRSANQMRQEFDREISAVFRHFQIYLYGDLFGGQSSLYERYGTAYAAWMQTASYPELVENVFLLEANPDRTLNLRRVDADGSMTAAAWPEQFVSLRREMEAMFAPGEAGLGLRGSPRRPIDPDIPVLLIPVVPISAPGARDDIFEFGPQLAHAQLAYAIVQLNIDYIQEEFLPALSRLYIAGDGESDYHVSVRHVSRSGPDAVIYQSDAAAPSASVADVSVRLMAIRSFDPGLFVFSRGRSFPSPRPFDGANPDYRASTRVLRESFENFGATQPVFDDGDGAWELALTHRSGSLEAAVTELRRRNLAISSSIMIVLAASIGMILVSTRRAQRLARQQIEFVSAVSHELRTPLAVIRGAAENLADGVVDNIEQARHYGSVVRREGRRLTDMVEQTLDFAGIHSQRKQYSLRAVDVRILIAAVLHDCELQIRDGGFQVDVDVPGDLPEVMADNAAMARVLQNLIQNAMKYGGRTRWIGVKAAAGSAAGGDAREVRISVQDRGPGISSRDLPHIFEPFYRGRDAVDGQIHGSGLGLSLVRNVVEAHGGRVSVDSVPGVGSTFTIHLSASPSSDG